MKRRTFITLLAVGSVAACARPGHTSIRGLTMGTTYAVELAKPVGDAERSALTALIETELAAINRSMSTYDPRSELSDFNRREDFRWMPASPHLLEVLDGAARISRESQGAFDATVAPLVDLWGFGPQFAARRVPGDAEIARAKEAIGYEHVHIDHAAGAIKKSYRGTRVDLSAIAKGYGVDRLAALLEDQGIDDYLVEIGGEFRAGGAAASGRAWRVGIERPVEGRRVLGETIVLENRAIATSGTTRDFFEQDGRHYSHCIHPGTGRPVDHPPMAVSVVADTAMEADAWATALLVLGPARGYALAQAQRLAALLVTAAGSTFDVRMTEALRAHVLA